MPRRPKMSLRRSGDMLDLFRSLTSGIGLGTLSEEEGRGLQRREGRPLQPGADERRGIEGSFDRRGGRCALRCIRRAGAGNEARLGTERGTAAGVLVVGQRQGVVQALVAETALG